MDTLFSIVNYLVFGIFGFLLLLFLLAMLFGKRVRKRWEFEAKFKDMYEREFGEFDFEMSRVDNDEEDFSFKATFRMKHASLDKGLDIEVFLDDVLVMRGEVKKAGRVYLRNKAILNTVSDPREGQVCRVVWGGIERFRAPIKLD